MILRLLVFVAFAFRVYACACAGPWPAVKEAWHNSPAVFLGTVELADPDESHDMVFRDQSVRIRVDEPFKGAAKGQLIHLFEGANDCAAKFRTGQRAVFYFQKFQDNWIVAPCTHSIGNAARGGDDLMFLHGLPKSALGTRFSGEVELARDANATVNFVLQADTKLSGHVLDSNGHPLPHVCMTIKTVGFAGDDPSGFFECSKQDSGFFEMKMMPPGKYWIVARDDIKSGNRKSQSTLYYPGVRDRRRATVVEIEAGVYVDGLDIKMPTDERRYRLSGQLVFGDGVPAPGGVTFRSAESGYSESTATSSDGSFEMLVVAGMNGELTGGFGVMLPMLERCPELQIGPRMTGLFRFIDTSPLRVVSDTGHEQLKLVLPSPSCKAVR